MEFLASVSTGGVFRRPGSHSPPGQLASQCGAAGGTFTVLRATLRRFHPRRRSAQALSSLSKDAGGFNYGVGVTYPLNALNKAKVFLEFRYHRAYQSDGQTIVMPITVGLRW